MFISWKQTVTAQATNLDTMIVEISDDNISARWCHSTEVWTGQVPRVG